jgi:hypothetical protein
MGLACVVAAGPAFADGLELKLRAHAIGNAASTPPLTIELFRWSSDSERAPLVAALTAPPPAPTAAAPAAGRAGRGGRGGRGAPPPLSPAARLTAAIKAAPTCGFIWGDGPTGYSIKYAWRSTSPDGGERIVLVTDRRLGAHTPLWQSMPGAPADAEFTVIEMRIGVKGTGEAKASLTTNVAVDAAAKTLALDAYDAAPVLLKVTR